MVRLRECLDHEVIASRERAWVGRPADLLLDPHRHRIAGIVLVEGDAPEAAVVVHAAEIESFEGGHIVITTVHAARVAFQDGEAAALLAEAMAVRRRPVLRDGGEPLGRIEDARIDAFGNVVEYRVRRGVALRGAWVPLGASRSVAPPAREAAPRRGVWPRTPGPQLRVVGAGFEAGMERE